MAVAVGARFSQSTAVPPLVSVAEAAALGASEVLARLESGTEGLAESDATRRLRVAGSQPSWPPVPADDAAAGAGAHQRRSADDHRGCPGARVSDAGGLGAGRRLRGCRYRRGGLEREHEPPRWRTARPALYRLPGVTGPRHWLAFPGCGSGFSCLSPAQRSEAGLAMSARSRTASSGHS